MGRPANEQPMTFEAMVEDGKKTRANSKLYRAQSLELSDERISELIDRTTEELAVIADSDITVSLDDTPEVKRRTAIYLRSCQTASVFPSISGLARSMGFSRNALYKFQNEHPLHPTTKWLALTHDAFSDILAESSLRNDCNTIASIFLQKALYGLRESVEIVNKVDTNLEQIPAEELINVANSLPTGDNTETVDDISFIFDNAEDK